MNLTNNCLWVLIHIVSKSNKKGLSNLMFAVQRILEREEGKMEEGAEGVVRAEEEGEGTGASQSLSRPHQFFPWEWVLLKNKKLVRINSIMDTNKLNYGMLKLRKNFSVFMAPLGPLLLHSC